MDIFIPTNIPEPPVSNPNYEGPEAPTAEQVIAKLDPYFDIMSPFITMKNTSKGTFLGLDWSAWVDRLSDDPVLMEALIKSSLNTYSGTGYVLISDAVLKTAHDIIKDSDYPQWHSWGLIKELT